jgi:translation initiation factor 1
MKQKSDSRLTGSGVDRIVYSEWGSPLDPESGAPLQDRPPQHHKLIVQRDRKGRGGKTVTVISGFQLTPATLDHLAKQLKTQCGSGGTAKETTIEIQGDHRDKVAEILRKLGYPVKLSGG